MAVETTAAGVALLAGRVAFGGVLAFMGLNHFFEAEQLSGYAAAKGVPAASLMVPFTGGMLLFGGLGIATGAFPVLAAGAVALFLLVSTPLMHDFWTVEDPEQKQSELTNFLKNGTMLGAALAFLALGGQVWPYAANVGLF